MQLGQRGQLLQSRREPHGARYHRQLWGAVMVQRHHRVQVAVQTRRDPDLVRRVNAHIQTVLPQLTYTALAVVHGVGVLHDR